MFQPQKFAQVRQSDLSSKINQSRFRFFGDGDSSIDRANEINLSRSSSFQDSGRISENNPDYYRFTLRNSSSVFKIAVKNRFAFRLSIAAIAPFQSTAGDCLPILIRAIEKS